MKTTIVTMALITTYAQNAEQRRPCCPSWGGDDNLGNAQKYTFFSESFHLPKLIL